MKKKYETVIGLEVHIELATETKLFCGCRNRFGGRPNTNVCPVCMGMPGALPVLNRRATELACMTGLALHSTVESYSRFDRKHYFYPDNPQNYQITQFYKPLCRGGYVTIETEEGTSSVRIHELHLEDDAGKLVHDEEKAASVVDFNRSGVPLIEIVSEPDMRSAAEAVAYLKELRQILRYLGVSDCKMNEGSMRADVNLSVRKSGSDCLGVRTEMKNLNSFREVSHAIEAERDRQIALLETREPVQRETRRWDEEKGTSFSMRSKEEVQDYRYFPEPDLPPVELTDAWLRGLRETLPELRSEKCARYRKEYALSEYDAALLTESKRMADIFEETVRLCQRPKAVCNWLTGETLRLLNKEGLDAEDIGFSPEHLAELIRLTEDGTINGTIAKAIFEQVFFKDIAPGQYAKEHALTELGDETELRRVIEKVLAENRKSVQDYQSGKEKAFGFLVGQTMRSTGGRAKPELVHKILREMLSCHIIKDI